MRKKLQTISITLICLILSPQLFAASYPTTGHVGPGEEGFPEIPVGGSYTNPSSSLLGYRTSVTLNDGTVVNGNIYEMGDWVDVDDTGNSLGFAMYKTDGSGFLVGDYVIIGTEGHRALYQLTASGAWAGYLETTFVDIIDPDGGDALGGVSEPWALEAVPLGEYPFALVLVLFIYGIVNLRNKRKNKKA